MDAAFVVFLIVWFTAFVMALVAGAGAAQYLRERANRLKAIREAKA